MNKYVPYIFIGIALLAGFILKDSFNFPNNDTPSENIVSDDNRIDNRFNTLLIYPKKNLLNKFSLINQNNDLFANQNLEGSWNLFFIGYTNCPDVCPNTLNQLTQLYAGFDQNIRDKYQIIFLSVDPKRDNPEHLKNYLDFFNDEFIGISGKKDQIDPLVKNLGGIYSINSDEGEFYTVDHSARIFIVDPKGRRFGIIDSRSLAKEKQQLIKDLAELVNYRL